MLMNIKMNYFLCCYQQYQDSDPLVLPYWFVLFILFIFCWLLLCCLSLIYSFSLRETINADKLMYLYFLFNMKPLLLPFIYFTKGLQKKQKNPKKRDRHKRGMGGSENPIKFLMQRAQKHPFQAKPNIF